MTDVSQSLHTLLERAQKQDPLGKLINEALVLIESVIDILGEEAVAISFNGGKDCTVLLHLYAAVLYARHTPSLPHHLLPKPSPNITIPPLPSRAPQEPLSPQPVLPPSLPACTPPAITPPTSNPSPPSSHPHSTHHHPPTDLPYPPIRSIYITAPNPFAELDEFVLSSSKLYGLDLYRFGGGMKAALEEWLGCGGGRGVKGVLVGIRQGDPNDAVDIIAPTDPSWPQFIRVHPILHWTYSDVWNFLLELQVPYCILYDHGYTSLGSTTNTLPNPLLKSGNVEGGWEPAHRLKDASQERAGRH
ncbi:hypothetical protein AYX14_01845 [Cryptococcus neoformans]|nr:FMN adenylyltransferase [Cryptococcus neoformans var. grubii Bt1]OWZ72668.1 hypothetical protein AYX14_01845 [Cryptococcus neoformans var. grubii]